MCIGLGAARAASAEQALSKQHGAPWAVGSGVGGFPNCGRFLRVLLNASAECSLGRPLMLLVHWVLGYFGVLVFLLLLVGWVWLFVFWFFVVFLLLLLLFNSDCISIKFSKGKKKCSFLCSTVLSY